jgi:prepilin-type N-terminal cleavage/methylation domain-containing protein
MITPNKKIENRIGLQGFTLVELLVSMAIMGVMVGMVLYTLAGAREDANRSKTKATIEKINAVILQRFEEYRYRAVKFPIPRRFTQRPTLTSRPLLKPRTAAGIRSILLKDMMRMEMPDRFTDLTYVPTNFTFPLEDGSTADLDDFGGRSSPRDFNVLRNFFNLASIPDVVTGPVLANTTSLGGNTWTTDWESAECLYAIVAHSMVAGGSALENFHASEIGDTDGDGYFEFIDAWGKPIGWLRWPAAYPSDLNISYMSSPDAFDPYRTDSQWTNTQKPWTLIPLIISAGPDGEFGIDAFNPTFAITRNAYAPSTDNPGVGNVLPANLHFISDNITNHDILLE